MDFGLAFTYPFQDPDWAKKLGLTALVALIPILGQIFVLGWMLDITRRVYLQDATPLPNLDFGKQFVNGLKLLLVTLAYTLPVYLILAPLFIVAATADNMDPDTANMLAGLASICCGGLALLYGIFVSFILPAAYGNMVVKDQLSAAFRLSEIIQLVRAAPGAYILAFLGTVLTGSIIAPLGFIACAIGVLFTYAYAMAVNGHLYGQAYNEAVRNNAFAG